MLFFTLNHNLMVTLAQLVVLVNLEKLQLHQPYSVLVPVFVVRVALLRLLAQQANARRLVVLG